MHNWNIRKNLKIMEDKYKFWVARDKNNAIYLFVDKPYRDNIFRIWNGSGFCSM